MAGKRGIGGPSSTETTGLGDRLLEDLQRGSQAVPQIEAPPVYSSQAGVTEDAMAARREAAMAELPTNFQSTGSVGGLTPQQQNVQQSVSQQQQMGPFPEASPMQVDQTENMIAGYTLEDIAGMDIPDTFGNTLNTERKMGLGLAAKEVEEQTFNRIGHKVDFLNLESLTNSLNKELDEPQINAIHDAARRLANSAHKVGLPELPSDSPRFQNQYSDQTIMAKIMEHTGTDPQTVFAGLVNSLALVGRQAQRTKQTMSDAEKERLGIPLEEAESLDDEFGIMSGEDANIDADDFFKPQDRDTFTRQLGQAFNQSLRNMANDSGRSYPGIDVEGTGQGLFELARDAGLFIEHPMGVDANGDPKHIVLPTQEGTDLIYALKERAKKEAGPATSSKQFLPANEETGGYAPGSKSQKEISMMTKKAPRVVGKEDTLKSKEIRDHEVRLGNVPLTATTSRLGMFGLVWYLSNMTNDVVNPDFSIIPLDIQQQMRKLLQIGGGVQDPDKGGTPMPGGYIEKIMTRFIHDPKNQGRGWSDAEMQARAYSHALKSSNNNLEKMLRTVQSGADQVRNNYVMYNYPKLDVQSLRVYSSNEYSDIQGDLYFRNLAAHGRKVPLQNIKNFDMNFDIKRGQKSAAYWYKNRRKGGKYGKDFDQEQNTIQALVLMQKYIEDVNKVYWEERVANISLDKIKMWAQTGRHLKSALKKLGMENNPGNVTNIMPKLNAKGKIDYIEDPNIKDWRDRSYVNPTPKTYILTPEEEAAVRKVFMSPNANKKNFGMIFSAYMDADNFMIARERGTVWIPEMTGDMDATSAGYTMNNIDAGDAKVATQVGVLANELTRADNPYVIMNKGPRQSYTNYMIAAYDEYNSIPGNANKTFLLVDPEERKEVASRFSAVLKQLSDIHGEKLEDDFAKKIMMVDDYNKAINSHQNETYDFLIDYQGDDNTPGFYPALESFYDIDEKGLTPQEIKSQKLRLMSEDIADAHSKVLTETTSREYKKMAKNIVHFEGIFNKVPQMRGMFGEIIPIGYNTTRPVEGRKEITSDVNGRTIRMGEVEKVMDTMSKGKTKTFSSFDPITKLTEVVDYQGAYGSNLRNAISPIFAQRKEAYAMIAANAAVSPDIKNPLGVQSVHDNYWHDAVAFAPMYFEMNDNKNGAARKAFEVDSNVEMVTDFYKQYKDIQKEIKELADNNKEIDIGRYGEYSGILKEGDNHYYNTVKLATKMVEWGDAPDHETAMDMLLGDKEVTLSNPREQWKVEGGRRYHKVFRAIGWTPPVKGQDPDSRMHFKIPAKNLMEKVDVVYYMKQLSGLERNKHASKVKVVKVQPKNFMQWLYLDLKLNESLPFIVRPDGSPGVATLEKKALLERGEIIPKGHQFPMAQWFD